LRSLLTGWRDWLRAWHSAILLGLALIALLWAMVELDLWRERARAEAAALTLLIVIGAAVGIRHRGRLEQARDELRISEARAREKSDELELTLDHMNQGIMVVDADQNVALMNRQVVKLLGLPEALLGRRPKFQDVLAYQRASGEFDANRAAVDPQVRRLIEGAECRPNSAGTSACGWTAPCSRFAPSDCRTAVSCAPSPTSRNAGAAPTRSRTWRITIRSPSSRTACCCATASTTRSRASAARARASR
jgi:PAS domain-containing protein